MNDLLLDLVKEQGIVNMINDYKLELEKIKTREKYDKVMKTIQEKIYYRTNNINSFLSNKETNNCRTWTKNGIMKLRVIK